MKIDVEFSVEEVTRYKITRRFHPEGDNDFSAGFDMGSQYGEFETRAAAEHVREALSATIGEWSMI